MLIDSFTVFAQIINFLILVALLKRFLYGPITRAMSQRQQKIQDQLALAMEKETAAQQEADRLHQMQQDFATHRDERLAEMRSHIEEQRSHLLAQAHTEVDTAKKHWYQSLEQEKAATLQRFQQQTTYHISQTVRQVLTDLANADLEQQVIIHFLKRLEQLPPKELKRLQGAMGQVDEHPMTIRSSFPLDDIHQQKLTNCLQRLTAHPISNPTFDTDPHLGCGIELRVPGYKLNWSVSAYLDALEHNLAHALDTA